MLVNISPRIEVLFRKLYWRNVAFLYRFRPPSNKAETGNTMRHVDFDKILEVLQNEIKGSSNIVIVHSSYKALKATSLSPEQIIHNLLDKVVGENGTLVMPVIRKYLEEGDLMDFLDKDMSNFICEYNVYSSPITTGVLPMTLFHFPNAIISRCPINPIVAIGPEAKLMVREEMEDEVIFPHGKNSAWYYCLKNEAIIIGLGVRLHHNLTIRRVFEELGTWPAKNWFRKRCYIVNDDRSAFHKKVFAWERRPCNTVYMAEEKMRKDLLNSGVLRVFDVDGIEVSIIESKKLSLFIESQKNPTYPYYF